MFLTWFRNPSQPQSRTPARRRRTTTSGKTRVRPLLEVLESRLSPAAHAWTGASLASATWSDDANWSEGAPLPGESNVTLLFPAAARTTNTNDLEGLTVAALQFTGSGYSLGGFGLTFRGDTNITANNSSGTNTIDLTLDQQPFFSFGGGPFAFFDHVYSVADGATLEVLGQITGAPLLNTLHKTGPGTLLLSSSLNDYGGTTLLEAGTLALGVDNAVPPSPITVALGATLDLNGHSASLGSLAGAGNVVYPPSPIRALTTGLDNSSTTFSGVISGPLSLVKVGGGAFTLAGVNTYTGATAVLAGSLVAGTDNAYPPNPCIVALGATLDLNGHNAALGSLAGAGDVVIRSGSVRTLTTGADNTSTTFSGVISGPGGLTKVGTGTFTLAGVNTYTGATAVVAGALLVNGSLSPLSVVSVSGGAVLGGTGAVRGPITATGVFSPGGSGPGVFHSGAFTFAAGSSFGVDLNGRRPGSGYDRLRAHGPVDLTAAPRLEVSLGFASRVGDRFTIVKSTGRITGQFAGLRQGGRFQVGDAWFRITYTRHRVVLTHVRPPHGGCSDD